MTNPTRIRPLTAMKAMRRLIADAERTEEVFTIVQALSGNSLERGYRRFRLTTVGHDVLASRRNLIDSLADTETLRALPDNSLGRAYLAFMESENLSADGLVDASASRDRQLKDPGLTLYAARLRDMHDLMHVTTGYGRDTFGELCLLAFTFAQTRNRGIGFIVLMGAVNQRKTRGNGVLSAVWQAFLAGRRSAWLPAENWEQRLSQPLDVVRRELGINLPSNYVETRQQWATA
jgi:ubiquinone biosynthesis protein COQ4